jgi:hypothetical protein
MTHLCIVCLYGVSVRFAIRYFVPSKVIPKQVIDIKAVAEIPFGLGSIIHDGLDGILGAIPEHFPA